MEHKTISELADAAYEFYGEGMCLEELANIIADMDIAQGNVVYEMAREVKRLARQRSERE